MDAVLKTFEYEERDCIGIGIEGDNETRIADVWDRRYANLFRSAPQLLESLKALVADAEGDEPWLDNQLLDKAKAAIAAAE